MNDTVYWAVKLDAASKMLLLQKVQPAHPNIYAEHMTLVFKPSDLEDEELKKRAGEQVVLTVTSAASDVKGQAVTVECDAIQSNNATPHITVSCADGVKPMYSNALLAGGSVPIAPFALTGKIMRFTKQGWQ